MNSGVQLDQFDVERHTLFFPLTVDSDRWTSLINSVQSICHGDTRPRLRRRRHGCRHGCLSRFTAARTALRLLKKGGAGEQLSPFCRNFGFYDLRLTDVSYFSLL